MHLPILKFKLLKVFQNWKRLSLDQQIDSDNFNLSKVRCEGKRGSIKSKPIKIGIWIWLII
jgi:hypothetical protein